MTNHIPFHPEHRHALSLREVLHQFDRLIVFSQYTDVQLSHDHPDHIQLSWLYIFIHYETIQSLLGESNLKLILVDLVRFLSRHLADRDRWCSWIEAFSRVTVRFRVAKMTTENTESFWLTYQLRGDVQPNTHVATFLGNRRWIYLNVESVLWPVLPWSINGDTCGWKTCQRDQTCV